MSLIGKALAPIYSGIATAKFLQGNYPKAIKYFLKAIDANPSDERMEYSYSQLGQSFLYLKNYKEAYRYCLKAYSSFHESGGLNSDTALHEYKNLLVAYIEASKFLGESKEAEELEKELEVLGTKKEWLVYYKK